MPDTARQWVLKGRGSYDRLELQQGLPKPTPGENEVLIKIKAASLNFRDIAIVRDKYPFPTLPEVVPLSDAAGLVEAVGSKVTRFQPGDRVMPIFTQTHLTDALTPDSYAQTLGGPREGVMRTYAAFNEEAVVRMPETLDFVQAASLPCAAVTAWNSLFGIGGRALKPGDWVLTQGTGGVSLFALQFAKAAGAYVVSTTSSADKAETLRQLGADHVLNYREDKEWGKTAKELTGGSGFKHILEVGGTATLRQSLNAVAIEGVISIIGFLGQGDDAPSFLEALQHTCIVRGIFVGSRQQLEELSRAVDANRIKPVVDDKVFKFDELKEAYEYMEAQKHFGKVCISFE